MVELTLKMIEIIIFCITENLIRKKTTEMERKCLALVKTTSHDR